MCRSSDEKAPIETVLAPPSWLAQYTCVSILLAIFAVWGKYSFIDEADLPNGTTKQIHSAWVPLCLTSFYLLSLPILKIFSDRFLKHSVDVKILLQPSMVIYNAAQVAINGWMVYRIVEALVSGRHDIIGGPIHKVDSGAIYPVYIHYCDKYLEFLDTYFMVLRGKMDQVRFGAR
jgi:elongation of very long chain fatty acids protein 4